MGCLGNVTGTCMYIRIYTYQEFIIKREGRVSNAVLHEQNTLHQVIASSSGYFSIISVNFNTWLCRKELVDRR